MFQSFCDYIILFMIYSFIGWIIEIVYKYIESKEIVNRGFLIGPYLPIYGIGSIGILLFLEKYKNDFLVLFCMGTILCCVLEYFTSYIMEKIFNARWWDYSNKKFNIAGRICLETAILFGLGGCFVVYLINPVVIYILDLIPLIILNIIAVLFFIIFMTDFCISFNIIFTFRTFTNNVKRDSTAEINKLVKRMIASKSYLGKRLIQAFPNFKLDIKKIKLKRRK